MVSRAGRPEDIVFTQVMKNCKGKFSVGDELSIADLCLVPQMYNAVLSGIDLEKEFPEIYAIDQEMQKIPEVAAAHPSKQPDAPRD